MQDLFLTVSALNITLQGKAKVAFYSNQVRWFKKHYQDKSGDPKEFSLSGIIHFDMNDIKIRRRLSERECFMAKETFVDITYQLAGLYEILVFIFFLVLFKFTQLKTKFIARHRRLHLL